MPTQKSEAFHLSDVIPNPEPLPWSSNRERRYAEWTIPGEPLPRAVEIQEIPEKDSAGSITGYTYLLWDVGERVRREKTIQSQMKLMSAISNHDVPSRLRAFIDEAENLTGSTLGFFLPLTDEKEDQEVLAWSSRTQEQMPELLKNPRSRFTSHAMLWIDAVRSGRPVVLNEYPKKGWKGMMVGDHSDIRRILIVPVFRNHRAIAILALANKNHDYVDGDVQIAQSFADVGWETVNRIQSEQRIQDLVKEKDLLLKEVHHRVKNNMATIGSLLSMRAMKVENDAGRKALESAHGQVLSMHRLYERLFQGEDVQALSLDDYLAGLVDEAIESSGRSITVVKNLSPVTISPQKAYALGIIVNELIWNAIKYAFPPEGGGTLSFSLEKKEKRIIITVSDDGPGFDPNDCPHGFGMELIQVLVETLEGQLNSSHTPGTTWILKIGQ